MGERDVFGPPLKPHRKRLLVLGAGELSKEIIIEAQRMGMETIAVDEYGNAPAMAVAHRAYVVDMTSPEMLWKLVDQEHPDLIVPESEVGDPQMLFELEEQVYRVMPSAKASQLARDRLGMRKTAVEELSLLAAHYQCAESLESLYAAVDTIGFPCVVKPALSLRGQGQSICRSVTEVERAWVHAKAALPSPLSAIIVEEFIEYEAEVTLLTVSSVSGLLFCEPIGHTQAQGDYMMSWQPHYLSASQLAQAKQIAQTVVEHLGGYGVFGVELFIVEDQVYFNRVSPRPRGTAMVTLVTQDLSEFALHVRAILGLPIPAINFVSPGASYAVHALKPGDDYVVQGLDVALSVPHTQVRMFSKPNSYPGCRMGVVLNAAPDVEIARERVVWAAECLQFDYYSS